MGQRGHGEIWDAMKWLFWMENKRLVGWDNATWDIRAIFVCCLVNAGRLVGTLRHWDI